MFEYLDHYSGKQIEYQSETCRIVKSLGQDLFLVIKEIDKTNRSDGYRPVYLIHWIDEEMKEAERRSAELLRQP